MDRVNRGAKITEKVSIKEQRAQRRAEKLAAFQLRLRRERRARRVRLIVAVGTPFLLVAAVVASIVLAPRAPDYTPGDSGIAVAGVRTFDNLTGHVEGFVRYPQDPPAGGEHSATPLECGQYAEPVPPENAVHSLEHGAIWATYRPADVDSQAVSDLRSLMPGTHFILSPYPEMETPIALSAWNVQLTLDDLDRDAIGRFIEQYWLGPNSPEPGAACSGLTAPGKVD